MTECLLPEVMYFCPGLNRGLWQRLRYTDESTTQDASKHVPQRTCIACRQVAGKRALIRLVRTEHGVVVDPTGKQAGRGAYLHPERACWEVVVKGNRLEASPAHEAQRDNRRELLAFAQTLPEAEAFRTPAPELGRSERAAFADGSA